MHKSVWIFRDFNKEKKHSWVKTRFGNSYMQPSKVTSLARTISATHTKHHTSLRRFSEEHQESRISAGAAFTSLLAPLRATTTMFAVHRMAASHTLSSSVLLSSPSSSRAPLFPALSAAKRLVSPVPRRFPASGLVGSGARSKKWSGVSWVRCAVATESARSASTSQTESLEETQKGEEEGIVLPTNESSDGLLRIRHTVSELIKCVQPFCLFIFLSVFVGLIRCAWLRLSRIPGWSDVS